MYLVLIDRKGGGVRSVMDKDKPETKTIGVCPRDKWRQPFTWIPAHSSVLRCVIFPYRWRLRPGDRLSPLSPLFRLSVKWQLVESINLEINTVLKSDAKQFLRSQANWVGFSGPKFSKKERYVGRTRRDEEEIFPDPKGADSAEDEGELILRQCQPFLPFNVAGSSWNLSSFNVAVSKWHLSDSNDDAFFNPGKIKPMKFSISPTSYCVSLCSIDPRVRKIRNEASRCPGIFSRISAFTMSLAPPVRFFVKTDFPAYPQISNFHQREGKKQSIWQPERKEREKERDR